MVFSVQEGSTPPHEKNKESRTWPAANDIDNHLFFRASGLVPKFPFPELEWNVTSQHAAEPECEVGLYVATEWYIRIAF